MLITIFGKKKTKVRQTFISAADAEREGWDQERHTQRTRMKYGKPYNRACDRVITESGDGIFFLLHCLLSGILIPKRNHK